MHKTRKSNRSLMVYHYVTLKLEFEAKKTTVTTLLAASNGTDHYLFSLLLSLKCIKITK